ncbi:hypothetical protein ES707_17352 [subsurface metagenome]
MIKLPSPIPKSKLEWVLWIVLLLILFGAFFGFDYFDGYSSYASEPSSSYYTPRRYALEDLFKDSEKPTEPVEPSPTPSTPLVDFNRFNWAPWASAWTLIGLIGFFLYVKGIYLIHNHAEHNGRNTVRWTTASILFSPIVAALIYLLTYPEKKG